MRTTRTTWKYVACVLLLFGGLPAFIVPTPAHAASPLDAWVPGDVHVHASGDSPLETNSACHELLGISFTPQLCAQAMVARTIKEAKDHGSKFLIYTEHVPWLAVKSTSVGKCATVPTGLKVSRLCVSRQVATGVDQAQANMEWGEIRDEAASQTPGSGVRALMGQELGTAGQVTLPLAYVKQKNGGKIANLAIKGMPAGFASTSLALLLASVGATPCPGYEAGHFGVYYLTKPLADSLVDCDESAYLKEAEEQGAWGAVNHPDNADGGSRWFCWNAGDARNYDFSTGRDTNRQGAACPAGMSDFGSTARAIELLNDRNPVTDNALHEADAMLLQGRRIAFVGGSDSHTSRPLELPVSGKTAAVFPAEGPGNDQKLGLVGRTWLPINGQVEVAAGSSFDPLAKDDPVRQAIAQGRSVASSGPLALPSVDGKYPGDTLTVSGNSVDVRVDFAGANVVRSDAAHAVAEHVGDKNSVTADVKIVVGVVNSCPAAADSKSTPCVTTPDGKHLVTQNYEITDEDRKQGFAMIPVALPSNMSVGYLRTEVHYYANLVDTDKGGQVTRKPDTDVALASPIYLQRDPMAVPATPLGTSCAHAPVTQPIGTTGSVTCAWSVSVDLDGNGKPDRLVVWRRASSEAAALDRTKPDDDSGAEAYLDDGSYHLLDEPTRTWKLGSLKDPVKLYSLIPSAVVDLNGDGRQEVLMQTVRGGANGEYQNFAILTLTIDQHLHATQYDDGAVAMITKNVSSSQQQDFGCVSSAGRKLVDVITSGGLLTYPATFTWKRSLFALQGRILHAQGTSQGYSSGDTRTFMAGLSGDCTAGTVDVGQVPSSPSTPSAAVSGLLRAAATGDETSGRYFIDGPSAGATGEDAWAAVNRIWAGNLPTLATAAARCPQPAPRFRTTPGTTIPSTNILDPNATTASCELASLGTTFHFHTVLGDDHLWRVGSVDSLRPKVIHKTAFVTPSKNIVCAAIDSVNYFVACRIAAHTFSPPRQCGEPAAIAAMPDIGVPTIQDCDANVSLYLPTAPYRATYGDVFDMGHGLRCAVTNTYVQCRSQAGIGFHLARKAYGPYFP